MPICKYCNKEFKHDPSTDFIRVYSSCYCSMECIKIALDYDGFWKWYKRLLNHQGSCFERDILRDSKDDLLMSWFYRVEEHLESLKNTG